MKRYIIWLICLLSVTAKSQTKYFYYYKGNKIPLEVDTKNLNIITSNSPTIASFYKKSHNAHSLYSEEKNSYLKIDYGREQSKDVFEKKIDELKKDANIKGIGLFFKQGESSSVPISNYFYVKLKKKDDYNVLENFSNKKGVKIISNVENMPLWYILSTTNNHQTSLDLSNQYYESGLFADVDPAFSFDFSKKCTNDPSFNNLWGMESINICKAWNITQGEGINVAIVDHGIDKTHNDLKNNIHHLSYNTVTKISSSDSDKNKSHGTFVAGIVGAIKDNNLQIVGVSPKAKLMSISNPLEVTPNISSQLASGISWAWQNGAHVINNSWGDQGGRHSGNLRSAILEESIKEALTKGRNGKGCVVVFASGNYNRDVDYPANSNSDIMFVGAIQLDRKKSSFSSYGSQLDVVAPGTQILSTLPNNQIGYNDGTSFAAPQVSAVAALVLSANPNLTGKEVRDIIEKTAQKVGGYNYQNRGDKPNGTWNNEMGYGLVDAYKAVQYATISGVDESCVGTPITFELKTLIPAGATIKWEYPASRMNITSGQGTKKNILKKNTFYMNIFQIKELC